ERKLKKRSSSFELTLYPTRDILRELGQKKMKNQILVGFALETDNEIVNAKSKLKSKNLDYIILNSLNDQGAGFGGDTNKVTIIDRKGKIYPGILKNKNEVASDIFNLITKKINRT
ncbi:MAG: phosphopantothenoylcysteine decarboxylase, partial [Bacteroidales bacterium]|nr:phosphopantothenoylcysteine decarboxylase [Bacteroidales bacterium]